jgi:hypothetical protein
MVMPKPKSQKVAGKGTSFTSKLLSRLAGDELRETSVAEGTSPHCDISVSHPNSESIRSSVLSLFLTPETNGMVDSFLDGSMSAIKDG